MLVLLLYLTYNLPVSLLQLVLSHRTLAQLCLQNQTLSHLIVQLLFVVLQLHLAHVNLVDHSLQSQIKTVNLLTLHRRLLLVLKHLFRSLRKTSTQSVSLFFYQLHIAYR